MTDPRTECQVVLEWLQVRLDGGPASGPAGIGEHLAACPDCSGRVRAAELLIEHFAGSVPAEVVRPHLSERIIREVRQDTRRRQLARWAAVGAAVAAALLLAVWLGLRNAPGRPEENGFVASPTRTPRAPSLRAELADAGEALVSITRRTAEETVGEGRLLLPRVELPPAAATALSTVAAPIDSTSRGLAQGFEPIATSARRAVNLFLSDRRSEDAPAGGER